MLTLLHDSERGCGHESPGHTARQSMGSGTADVASVSYRKPKYVGSQAKIARTRRPEPAYYA